jgi:hypothetical protein
MVQRNWTSDEAVNRPTVATKNQELVDHWDKKIDKKKDGWMDG